MEVFQPITRPAEYIGSFLVSGKGHHERAEIVRQKLEAARKYTHSKPITLLISLSGVKVCHENNERVYMAHALRRISYATCDPDNFQFAFLAREPKAQPNIQYCHAFVTATPEAAEELNTIMGEAFRLAYAQQRLNAVSNNPNLFQSSTISSSLFQAQQTPVSVTRSVSTGQNVLVSLNSANQGAQTVSTNPSNDSQIIMSSKPLPPLPETEQSVAAGEEENIQSNVGNVTDKQRGNKAHKHKHHKHHHRHKLRDATTSTSEQAVGVGDSSEAGAQKNSEMERCVEKNEQLKPPPPPPPRSQSSVTPSAQGQVLNTSSSTVNHMDQDVDLRNLGVKRNETVSNKSVENVTDAPPLRPKSVNTQLSHFYDMADHRSCGGISFDKETLTAEKDIQECNPEFTTDSVLANTSTATTTSSSTTTGCSTATSGSGCLGSGSDNSLSAGKRCTCVPGCANCEHTCVTVNNNANPGNNNNNNSKLLKPNDHHLPVPPTSPCSTPNFSSRNVVDDVNELSHAPWYLPNLPRDKALEMLAKQPPGSFVVRDSGSHPNSYALSVRSSSDHAVGSCFHSRQSQVPISRMKDVLPSLGSVYPSSASGITHFLIQKTPGGGVKLKGLDKEWPSLACLVLHLTVMPEMLPCPLRLPRASANPTFSPVDHCGNTDFEKPPNVTPSQFRPMGNALHRGTDTISLDEALARMTDEDEDYQRLSDFSSIMADLKLQPRNMIRKQKNASSKSGGRGR
uniref:SH2 domain-containing protein n=1 Tax=Trichobilharzia regenti TaxID=157069 RepID=A0AA85K679_TRIRE|nr:unnamed protein product [Trichobilharzia regenti]